MTLHAEHLGHGTPLVLIHGLGGSIHSWALVADGLALSRRLVLVDLPGHGASPPFAGPPSFAALADAVAGFLRDEGLEQADLVGSSIGARLALEMARRGIGGSVVSFDPAGFWNEHEARYVYRVLGTSMAIASAARWAIPAVAANPVLPSIVLSQISARPAALPAAFVKREMRSTAETHSFHALLRDLALGPRQQGTASAPGRITIGWGRRDRLLVPRQAARALAAFPTARMHWFERCGHFPHWDRPDEAIRVILEGTSG